MQVLWCLADTAHIKTKLWGGVKLPAGRKIMTYSGILALFCYVAYTANVFVNGETNAIFGVGVAWGGLSMWLPLTVYETNTRKDRQWEPVIVLVISAIGWIAACVLSNHTQWLAYVTIHAVAIDAVAWGVLWIEDHDIYASY